MSYCKDWTFTLNNPKKALQPELDWPDVSYYRYQEEIGESGTHHYQGFVQFSAKKRMTALKKLPLMYEAHWEPRKGSTKQADEYCDGYKSPKKTGTVIADSMVVWGTMSQQGSRNDITDLVEAIMEKRPPREIYMDSTINRAYARYPKFVAEVKAEFKWMGPASHNREKETELWLFYGVPHSGKSRKARSMFTTEHVYEKLPEMKENWEGYVGQKAILLDEFYGWIAPHWFLRVARSTAPFPLNVKYSSTNLVAEAVMITSNKLPSEWWGDDVKNKYDMSALYDRITRIFWFPDRTEKDVPGVYTEYNSWNAFMAATFIRQ